MNVKHLCPPGETIWTTYYKHGIPHYIVTSKTGNREFFFCIRLSMGSAASVSAKHGHRLNWKTPI